MIIDSVASNYSLRIKSLAMKVLNNEDHVLEFLM